MALNRRSFQNLRLEIKKDLDRMYEDEASKDRLSYIKEKILALSAETDARCKLELYIYTMFGLVQHERHGGLSDSEITKFERMGRILLLSLGIPRKQSNMSFLYGDLNTIRGQIERRNGQHLSALWRQYWALESSTRENPVQAFYQVNLGNRFLRVGQTKMALAAYEKAEKTDVVSTFESARMGRIKSLRLAGRIGESQELAQATALTSEMGALELDFEKVCIEATQKADYTLIKSCVYRKKPHNIPIYMVIALLYARASKDNLDQFLTLSTLKQRATKTEGNRYKLLFEIIGLLENCYDEEIPLEERRVNGGEILALSAQLVTIEQEMLTLMALYRWLLWIQNRSFAQVFLSRYQQLSNICSSGQKDDVLAVTPAGTRRISHE
jgi:hypothetical protein